MLDPASGSPSATRRIVRRIDQLACASERVAARFPRLFLEEVPFFPAWLLCLSRPLSLSRRFEKLGISPTSGRKEKRRGPAYPAYLRFHGRKVLSLTPQKITDSADVIARALEPRLI